MEPNPSQRLAIYKRSLIGKRVRYYYSGSDGYTEGSTLLDWADGWLLFLRDDSHTYAVREGAIQAITAE